MKVDVQRLRELYAAATIPEPWAVCEAAPNPFWIDGQTIGAADPKDARRVGDIWHPADAALVVAIRNALPELLAIAEAYAASEEAVVLHWGGADVGLHFKGCTDDDLRGCAWNQMKGEELRGRTVRLVRVVGEAE